MSDCDRCQCGKDGEDAFWCEFVAGLLYVVDIVERMKLKRSPTTAECRRTVKGSSKGKT